MQVRTQAEWYAKADSLVAAHAALGFPAPSWHAAVLELCVAQHETNAGDAMFDARGSAHDWGACTLRMLSPIEAARVKNFSPVLSNIPAAQLAEADLAPDDGVLWCDSHPISGGGTQRYWVWFIRADTDEVGAEPFVKTICRTLAEQAALDDDKATPFSLAAAMYYAHYYTGFHDPSQPGGIDLNISDYDRALEIEFKLISRVLADWHPKGSTWNLTSNAQIQAALTRLGFDTGGVDGILGAKSHAALAAFQAAHQLPDTSQPDPKTLAALQAALTAASPETLGIA